MTPTILFIPGDILKGRKESDAFHPIVYLGEKSDDLFKGAMITTSSYNGKNILMKVEHFKEIDDEGNRFEIIFNNTHLVKAKLLKKNEWQPFRKVGELTEEGLIFLKNYIDSMEEKLWED